MIFEKLIYIFHLFMKLYWKIFFRTLRFDKSVLLHVPGQKFLFKKLFVKVFFNENDFRLEDSYYLDVIALGNVHDEIIFSDHERTRFFKRPIRKLRKLEF